MTGAQEDQDRQSQENGLRPERVKKTQEQAHEKQKPESQVEGKSSRRVLDVHVQDSREVRHRPTGAYLPCAASHISSVMLWKTTSAEATLRLRAMDLLRERKTVNVSG